jgi:hypothetical protein
MRESFIFYRSFFEAVVDLPRDVRGEVLTAIIEYGLNGETNSQLKPIAKGMLTLIKPQIDANQVRYENGCKGGDFGKLGGAPKGNQNARKNKEETNPKQPQNNPKTTPNDNVNDNDILKKPLSNESVKKSATKVATLAERKQSFALSLEPYLSKYSRDMLNDFYAYWTEENQSRTKMRFELEKTWGLGGRLATWARRDNNFKTTSNGTNYKSYQQIEREHREEQDKQFADHIRQKLAVAIS